MSSLDEAVIDRIEDRATQRGFDEAQATYIEIVQKKELAILALQDVIESSKKRFQEKIDEIDQSTATITQLTCDLDKLRAQLMTANHENVRHKKDIASIRVILKIPPGFQYSEIVEFIKTRMNISHKRQPKKET